MVSDQGAGAIAAFERASKEAGIVPPERYPPSVSGDSITTNDLAYSRLVLLGCVRVTARCTLRFATTDGRAKRLTCQQITLK